MTAKRKEYEKRRCRNNTQYRAAHNLRRCIQDAMKRGRGIRKAELLLGCSLQEYRNYLQSLFVNGMSWDNYGKWHIDHIVPCAFFDLTDEKQIRECFNYRNTRPLWAKENLVKGSRIC